MANDEERKRTPPPGEGKNSLQHDLPAGKFYGDQLFFSLWRRLLFFSWQWIQTAQIGYSGHNPAGKINPFCLPGGKQRGTDPHPDLAAEPPSLVLNPHGDERNGSTPRPSRLFLKTQDPLDEAVLASSHAPRIVGALGKKDDELPLLQKPLDVAKCIEVPDRILTIDGDPSHGGKKVTNSRVDEEFLLGDKTDGPAGSQRHDGNIGPELVFGKKYPRSMAGDIFPAFHPHLVAAAKT